MSTIVHANKREAGHRSVISNLRKNGFVPAVVYGYQTDSTSIAVNARDFEKTLREDGKNAVITLDIEGNQIKAVINDAQRDTLKGQLIHLDFLAVNMSESLEVSVPIVTTGESVGVKENGVLQQPNREVTIKVKPSDIPENIEVDITNLAIGDTLTIGDIREKVNYTIVGEDDVTLVTISAPVELKVDENEEGTSADIGTEDNEEQE
ncbi:50S ribosomal protein L25/general stress protein Ctc [Rummeliibacillus sp. JY-2-4R]